MKKINVRFDLIEDPEVIDVLVTASEKDEQVLSLMDRVDNPLAGFLAVYDSESTMITIPERSIISLAAGNKRVTVRTEDNQYELKKPLKEALKVLHPDLFVQISRFEIINLDKVKRFDFSIAGTLQIEMRDGTVTWASRRLIPEIKKRLAGKEAAE